MYFFVLQVRRPILAAWNNVLTEVEKTRDKIDGLLRLFPANLSGDSLFGLTESAVSKMTESVRMKSSLCI